MENQDAPRILFVDDEPEFLSGIEAMLRSRYQVSTALSGVEGIRRIEKEGPFPVVVSDLKMPLMDGVEFLKQVRRLDPGSVRILLTGKADTPAAMDAVNEGNIFRFLGKPCPPPLMAKAIEDALEQFRIVTLDRRLLERKLEELSKLFLHAERLSTLGTLAGGVGHELTNIASAFSMLMDLLQMKFSECDLLDQGSLDQLNVVLDHVKLHARHLVELGRPIQDRCDLYDLRELVSDTLELLKLTGKTKYINVRLSLPKELVLVEVNRTHIEQVLINLVGNAADAVMEVSHERRNVEVTVKIENGQACCEIKDKGPGIPAEKMEKIFEPYFTTKPSGRGTGLGLPVVRQIIESYKGNLGVESQAGAGARFRFRLPLRRADG
ncbi:MAG: response regulator [Myxococcales bacterium]|nr:MAG: response regulator [Myxococcales bacterium]